MTCGYDLGGHAGPRCPECGRRFDPDDPATFDYRPPFIAWRFWAPGLVLSIGGGLLVVALLMAAGGWGAALWFGVPFAAGIAMGYRLRTRWFLLPLVALFLAAGLFAGLVTLSLSGVFCGMMLVGIFLGPIAVGLLTGTGLRIALRGSRWSQRWYLPAFIVVGLPWLLFAIEGQRPTMPTEHVMTTRLINAAPDEAWDNLIFYEDVGLEPPLLLRLGLPRPLRSEGVIERVGDIRTCLYSSGHIRKRVTAIEPGQTFAFDVIEQDVHFEHDVLLRHGSFTLEPDADGRTLLTLRTDYEPLVGPRWLWRPIETSAVHALHGHVIDSVEAAAQGKRALAPSARLTADLGKDHPLDRRQGSTR